MTAPQLAKSKGRGERPLEPSPFKPEIVKKYVPPVVIDPPEVGDVAYPIDVVGRGHYVQVTEVGEGWVKINAHYPAEEYPDNKEPHERKLTLAAYGSRYEK